ncbi:MAG: hypothetical protein HRT93_03185 [Piscirickettsiaceae bacterium]|nr:hypothetical protein [Piscirickettsiaceae bacterium]
MLEQLRKMYKQFTRKSRVRKALSTPQGRLDILKAGYKKFSSELTERERKQMRKDIKKLEREIRRDNRQQVK